MHSQYPNPPHAKFSNVWGRMRIREILSNKRSHLKKLVYDDGVNVAAVAILARNLPLCTNVSGRRQRSEQRVA